MPASSNTTDSISDLWSGFVDLLPELGAAAVVFVIFVGLGAVARRVIRRITRDHSSANVGQVLGRLAQAGLLLLGLIIAVTIVAPSVGVSELFALLGIGSVAIGFAFRDILQNFLAGILLLIREPFHQGDRVIYAGYEGTVEEITTRSTLIKTYDGNRIVVPNGEIYTNPITVLTAFPYIRTSYVFGVGYENDLDHAIAVIREAVGSTPGVRKSPEPTVEVAELGPSTVDIRALWWTENADALDVRAAVLKSVKEATERAKVTMPYPTRFIIQRNEGGEEDPVETER